MLCKQQAVKLGASPRSRTAPLLVRPARVVPLVAPKSRGLPRPILCASGLAHPGEEVNDQLQQGSSNSGFDVRMGVPNVTMAKGGGGGFGSSSALGAVMEKARLSFVMPTPVVQGPKLDDGGSGGDIGKRNHNGGGGGGDDGDDDDYFANGDDEGGDGEGSGDGFFRTVVPEMYDRLSIAAVLSEWMRTLTELPLIIKRAVEMGLFSSAQLVRFFSMDVRPNITRSMSRALPPQWARELVGRLMADPAFLQKLVFEQTFAAGSSLLYEYQVRGERFKEELDQVFINVLTYTAATGAAAWLVAPSRSYGNVHKFPWQQMLSDVPNCIFDASGPMRDYSLQRRVTSFFLKMAELSAVGAVAGSASNLLCTAATRLRQKLDPSYQPSMSGPDLGRASAGGAAFFALHMHTRYQLLGGIDRYLFSHSNYLWTYLAATAVARFAASRVGEAARPWFMGLQPAPPLTATLANLATRRVRRVVRRSRRGASKVAEEASSTAVAVAGEVEEAVAPEAMLEGAAASSPVAVEGAVEEAMVPAVLEGAEHLGSEAPASAPVALLEDAEEADVAPAMSHAEVVEESAGASSRVLTASEHEQQQLEASNSYQAVEQEQQEAGEHTGRFSDLVIVTSSTAVDPQAALSTGGTYSTVHDSETVQAQLQQQGGRELVSSQ